METTSTITVHIGEELKRALEEFATKNQLSRSDVIRISLKKFLHDGDGDLFVR